MGRHKKEVLKTDDERFTVSQKRMDIIRCIYGDIKKSTPYTELVRKTKQGYGLGVKYSQYEAYCLIRQARKMIQDDFREYVKSAREEITSSIMDIANESRQKGDRKNALDAMKYLGKFLGVEEPQKLDINSNETIRIEFN